MKPGFRQQSRAPRIIARMRIVYEEFVIAMCVRFEKVTVVLRRKLIKGIV